MKAHLAKIRKGWQNENLARYILSKFSFISQPVTIADDIGSDFFCTTFQTISEDDSDYLIPKNSFAIQIKSRKSSFPLSNKLEYLNGLEIPFCIGICNQTTLELTLFSGEYLIPFFVDVKNPANLRVEFCERDTEGEIYWQDNNGNYVIKFPKLITISGHLTEADQTNVVSVLSEFCNLISKNIVDRKNGEYIFREYASTRVLIPFTVSYVKSSLEKRVSKIFFELTWLLERKAEIFSPEELLTCQDLSDSLSLFLRSNSFIDE